MEALGPELNQVEAELRPAPSAATQAGTAALIARDITEFARRHQLDRVVVVNVASTEAARLFGLFPRKGTVQPGADADLVVFDPKQEGTISARNQQMNVDYSAFEGWPIQGRVDTVTVRGRVQVRSGRFVGAGDYGRMLKREPTHGT